MPALRAKSVLCPSRISIDNEPPAPTEKIQSRAFTSTTCDENHPIKVESIDDMNFKNDREQTVPNRVPSPSLVSPSLVRSPSLIRYNTSPDVHRRTVGLTGTQASPGAQHQLYGGSFRARISSMSSSPQSFSHPLAGSPTNSLKNPQQNPPTINPYHHRTDTEIDWLYDRNAELQLEIDKLARQVKVQNMVARNEGRRAAAKIDALEAALLDMERQNAKLVAESKRARIREKRDEGSEGGQRGSGVGLGFGGGQRYGKEGVSSTDSIKLRELSEGSNRRRSYRSPSPEDDSRTTLLPRRRSMRPHGRSLASELELSDDQEESGMHGIHGNTGTPPVNDIPLVDLPQEEEPASLPAPATRISSTPVASQTLSPDHIPSNITSDVSGLPRRSSTYLTPSQPEGTPQTSLYSPNSFPTSRLGVRNRSRLFPSSAGSPNLPFQVWASPGSPYRSPGSTIEINSRFSGGRKTLASELANWAMDMEEDETLEEQEIEAVLHEAEARAEAAGGQDHWRTTRSGRYSLLEKDQRVYSFTSGQEVDGIRDTTTETTTPDSPNPTGSFLGRIFQRIKRFYQSTWLEIQFIWVVLIFLRRVWIEGRQGLVLRSKVKDKKLE
ncbi:hypothetical protein HD553DRAFT_346121 [Filobasidium floriforme]|uniref:uncharacterized protein n=1 Tax=Filobasidium floriforme TaxID=5210 RepID=UPI001E8E8292|nr:uncharacterized protein HD553DRAFT_346121 [Filobasidium floriforme]KAH8078225.1 hypothetical protein HD553DRAFT_346121 [Filobasidium floriforme]